jgi:porin
LGTAATHDGNHGFYVIGERTLAGKTGEPGNIEAHVRYGAAPEDRNEVAWAIDTAVAATGLWSARPNDVISLGFVHAAFSSHLPGQDYEQVFELNYSAPLNDWLTVKPDLQYIRHTGGGPARDDALLFILRLTATY